MVSWGYFWNLRVWARGLIRDSCRPGVIPESACGGWEGDGSCKELLCRGCDY